jgi:L-fucose mutarotase/ribose pyranase (RbsD/FucU family)
MNRPLIAIGALGAAVLFTTMWSHARNPISEAPNDWKTVLAQRVLEFGHRNWIVIADSAYPAQTRDGIETVVTHQPQLTVVKAVLAELASARHVRPVVYLDKELSYVADTDATGIETYREDLQDLLGEQNATVVPHAEILAQLDRTGQSFKVLVLKTDLTLPYTSVFVELDCRYWSPEAEGRLRRAMQAGHE